MSENPIDPTKAELRDVSDLDNVYRLALGREPENHTDAHASPDVVSAALREAFSSLEFSLNIGNRIAASRRLRGGLYDFPPGRPLAVWASAALPLTSDSRTLVAAAGENWLQLYRLVFADPEFRRSIGDAMEPKAEELVEPLGHLLATAGKFDIDGEIETVVGSVIRGWAIDHDDIDTPLTLRLLIDGTFAGIVVADKFRRDLQDRLGGDGRVGFLAELPDGWRNVGAALCAEIVHPASGVLIGTTSIRSEVPPLGDFAHMNRQLRDIRELLEKIESGLPAASAGIARPLEDYPAYWVQHYSLPGQETLKAAAAGCLIIEATDASAIELDAALNTAIPQLPKDWTVLISVDSEDPVIEDLVERFALRTKASVFPTFVAPASAPTAWLIDNWPRDLIGPIVMMDGHTRLADDALARLTAPLAANEALFAVYADEDLVDPDTDRHQSPRLKPAFDRDLLLQENYVGHLVAFASGATPPPHIANWKGNKAAALLLQASAAPVEIGHIARVLSSRSIMAPDPSDHWLEVVRSIFEKESPALLVQPHVDTCGATRPNAARATGWTDLGGTDVTVIIPTRDGGARLKTCIDSIQQSRRSNAVEIKIVVIDNDSSDSATLSYLDFVKHELDVDVVRRAVPFNWALLNNEAARQATSDVLVFLNDDTEVLTETWCDALADYAMRSDVAAVGARLVYPDASLQHVGLVMRDRRSFAAHEALGDPASSAGYLGRNTLTRQAMAVTGACMATRREVFHQLGGFDSANFPVEGNDVDFCLRGWKAGLKTIYTPSATLIHRESETRGFSRDGEKLKIAQQANHLLWSRWGSEFGDDPFFNLHFDRINRPLAFVRPPSGSVNKLTVRKSLWF